MNTNFLAENTLLKLAPDLHKRYTQCVAKADTLLVRYRSNFPEYTDHTLLHSVEVTNLCNYLISNRIGKMNVGELYILLMAAMLHDVGMGLSAVELEKYRPMLNANSFYEKHPDASEQEFIREFHHELGALFVKENWNTYLKIPDATTANAIALIGQAHRMNTLEDRSLFPTDLILPICDSPVNMPYLAAVLQVSDEMDISASRNLMLQYAGFIPKGNRSVMEFQKHRIVRSALEDDRFIINAETDDQKEYDELIRLGFKVEKTLNYCQRVVENCTGDELPIRFVSSEIRFTKGNAPLIMELERGENALTIALSGKLDTITAPLLEKKLADNLGGAVKALILDFSSLSYISSAGLRVILSAKKKMVQMQGDMRILDVSDEIMEIFRMTGFDSILQLDRAKAQ